MVSITKPRLINDSSADTSLRWPIHRSTSSAVEVLGPHALFRHDLDRGVDDGGIAFVQHEQGSDVAGAEVPFALDGVVEPQHGGSRAAAKDAATRVEPFLERSERVTRPDAREAASGWARRRAPTITPSVPSEPTNT